MRSSVSSWLNHRVETDEVDDQPQQVERERLVVLEGRDGLVDVDETQLRRDDAVLRGGAQSLELVVGDAVPGQEVRQGVIVEVDVHPASLAPERARRNAAPAEIRADGPIPGAPSQVTGATQARDSPPRASRVGAGAGSPAHAHL